MPLDSKYLEILRQEEFDEEDFVSLNHLAQKVRNRILEVVSKNGGHLSSTLGAVELIIGMHCVLIIQETLSSLM